MKPFDLEQAKNGSPVVTRDGRKVKIVRQLVTDDGYDLLCNVDGSFLRYRTDGKYIKNVVTNNDLMMADKETTLDPSDKEEKCENVFKDITALFESMFGPIKESAEPSKQNDDSTEILPFNFEEARMRDLDVRTKNGYKVRVLNYEMKNDFPIIGVVKFPDNTEKVFNYTKDGTNSTPNRDFDLVLVKDKREGWIIRDRGESKEHLVYNTLFKSLEEAETIIKERNKPSLYITKVSYFE